MDLIANVAESFLGGGDSNQRTEFVEEQQERFYGDGPGEPPFVPRPWFAEWSEQDRTYIYINEETGERTFQVPYGGGAGGYQSGYQQQERFYEQDSYEREQYQREEYGGSSGVGAAMGFGAAGMVAGAALGYEGERIHNDFDYEKDRLENDVEDFPENAAEWTGEKVGEAEYAAHEFKEGVEDIPEDIAGWVGEKVGGVERFGDEVEGAYDMGKADGRDGW